MNYLGIDLGTSSVKAILVNQNLEILYTASESYPLHIIKSGYSEQDPKDWFDKTIEVLKLCILKSKQPIKAISFAGQMHGLVTLDQADNIIRPAILWNDQRTIKECEYLNQQIGSKNLLKWTKNIALTGFTAPKILWLKDNEHQNFEKIQKIMLPKDYLAYRLSGIFATDVSDVSGTLYYDVEAKKYSQPMLEILGISEQQLPKVYESNQKIGTLKSEICMLLNIDYEVDIIIGGSDQAVGAIGCKNITNGDVNISLGTSGVVFSPCEKCHKNENGYLHSFCDATGKFHTMGVMLSAAGCVNWWYDEILKNSNYLDIESQLLSADAKDLFFLPYLSGERSVLNDPKIRGSFHNLSLEHSSCDMTLAVIEGITFGLKQIFDSMEVKQCSQIKVTSGGAKNNVWLQIIADVFNIEVVTINTEEGPAFGAAILAIAGSNQIEVNQVYKNAIVINKKFSPSNKVEFYDKKYKIFKQIYPTIKKINYQ